MPSAALVVLDEARLFLNDVSIPGGKLYTNTKLLPCLRKAYRELQQKLADNGVSSGREQDSAMTLVANTIELAFADPIVPPCLPLNLLYPIMLHEKFVGQANTEYVRMDEKTWPPDIAQDTRLHYWSWEDSKIKLVGATGTVILRIRYWGSLEAIVDETTIIPVPDSETFLAARTASIAATTIGGMPTKGAIIQNDAEEALNTLLSTAVKNRQALPVRRRPFRSFRFGGRTFWR